MKHKEAVDQLVRESRDLEEEPERSYEPYSIQKWIVTEEKEKAEEILKAFYANIPVAGYLPIVWINVTESIPQEEEREEVESEVEVETIKLNPYKVVKAVSTIGILSGAASLVITVFTGIRLLHPFLALMFIIAGGTYWIMAKVGGKKADKPNG